MSSTRDSYHPDYYKLYSRRNRRKVRLVVRDFPSSRSVLDIGCNRGYIVDALLRRGLVEEAHGLEMHAQAVDPALMADRRFSFHEGDIADFRFDRDYDVIVYFAVHHHVFATHGRDVALVKWQEIVDHCRSAIYFETGEIRERGELYWRKALRRYYREDEEQFRELAGMIGPRLVQVRLIGYLGIHGVVRRLLRFDLTGPTEHDRRERDRRRVFGGRYVDHGDYSVTSKFLRTMGSGQQRLVEVAGDGAATKGLYEGTAFYLLEQRHTGRSLFSKKIHADVYKEVREFLVSSQVDHPRIAKVESVDERFGLVLPYVGGVPFSHANLSGIINKRQFRQQLRSFFHDVSQLHLSLGEFDFEANAGPKRRRLIDIIDLHPNNFLLLIADGRVVDWKLIDTEYVSNHNGLRNSYFRALMLKRLGALAMAPIGFCLRAAIAARRVFAARHRILLDLLQSGLSLPRVVARAAKRAGRLISK